MHVETIRQSQNVMGSVVKYPMYIYSQIQMVAAKMWF